MFLAFLTLILISSLYANYLHAHLFFSKPILKLKPEFLKKGKDISFISDGYLLKGKIVTQVPKGKRVPLIVFCVGSAESSYASNYASIIDSLILENLPMDSLAVLYFDKRGIGFSEGNWYNTTFEERAADAKAAADMAKKLPYVDSSRIILAGHSQGGWIVQVGLAQYPGTFYAGISLAGATFDVKRQIINDYTSNLICSENLPADIAEKKAITKTLQDITLASFFPFQQNWKQLKVIKDFDPEKYLKKINSPLLFVWGENDALVNPTWCKSTLVRDFPKGIPSNFDTLTIDGANHGFRTTELCYLPHHKYAFSKSCKNSLLTWVRKKILM